MKITLEFKNTMEHNKYCIEQVQLLQEKDLTLQGKFEGKPIQVNTKRKTWSQYELNFIKEYYTKKRIRWIAMQLGRKPTAVTTKLHIMYKEGLPLKRPHSGEVKED